MFKTAFHLLAVVGLALSACGPIGSIRPIGSIDPQAPAAPEPTQAAPGAPSVPTAASTPPPTPEPILPSLLTHRAVTRGTEGRRPSILLHFNRAMDRASVVQALRVGSGAAFTFRWENDDRDLYLTPVDALDPQQIVRFTLTRQARDLEGHSLTQAESWTYQTPSLTQNVTVTGVPGPDSPITIRFNYDLQPWSVERAFALEPHVEGEVAYDRAGQTLTFTPAVTLTAGTSYAWTLDRPLWDGDGRPLLVDVNGTFDTPPLVIASPGNGETDAPIDRGITLRFTQPVDQDSVERAFALAPATAGAFTWLDEETMDFLPEGGFLQASTRYVVTLDQSLTLASGSAASTQPFSIVFHTQAAEPIANFGPGTNAQVVDAQGRRSVQFAYSLDTRVVAASFALHAVTLEDFIAWAVQPTTNPDGSPVAQPDVSRYPLVASWSLQQEAMPPSADSYYSSRAVETSLPADVAPGLYVLEMSTIGTTDTLWIALTSQALQVRRSETQLLAWLTDINGAPTADSAITILAADGQTLTSATTNADGLAKVDLERVEDAAWVVAGTGSDRTITGLLSGWKANDPWWWSASSSQQVNEQVIYVTTDRPIYRPGDTVHFKALVRRDHDGALTVEPERELTIRLRDSRSNVVRTIFLKTDAYGAVDSLFRIADGAMLGDYAIEVVSDGETHRLGFKVEAYRKPEIAVDLTTDADAYAVGQSIRGTVDTAYFFDAPAVNARVTVRLFDVTNWCSWDGVCSEDAWFPQAVDDLSGVTDASGRFVFSTQASSSLINPETPWYYDGTSARIGLEATVNDGGGAPVSAHLALGVFASSRQLEWLSTVGVRTPDETATIRAGITDLTGKPVSGQAARLEVRVWNERSLDYSTLVEQRALISDASGLVETPLALATPGYYQIRLVVSDAAGRQTELEDWAWVDSMATGFRYPSGEFVVAADRITYAPGDQAVLTIRSDFSGPALISVGRTGLLREQVATLRGPVTQVVVPILPGDSPNLNVTVSAWKPGPETFSAEAYYSQSDSQRVSASVALLVPPIDKQLTVAVTPDRETYAAGAQATFDLRVTNAAGQPVQAQITAALVDEAIFRLSDEGVGPIFDTFYYVHGSRVADFDSFMPQRRLTLYDGCECGGGGGGDGGPGLRPRNDFSDTALWEPTLLTDADGRARLTVTLPDSLTTWRLTARAATVDSQFGEALSRVVTRQDVNVRPLVPATLTTGDDVDLVAIVHNNTTTTRTLDVGILPPAGLELRNPLTQTVQVDAERSLAVRWRASAREAGEVTLTFWTMDPADQARRDAVEARLSVHPLAVPDVRAQVGEAIGDVVTLTVTAPADVLDMSRVELALSASVAGSITEGLVYLTGYPYGCVEQTMSRALPNAVVARAFRSLDMAEVLDQSDLARKIDASVQRLYGFQHDDGGWGWWTDDATDDYQTAWVLFGLAQTRDAGYQVDAGVIERGAAYLKGHLTSLDSHTRAFALYSLALSGHGDLAATQAAMQRLDSMDAFSRAALALALHQLGDDVGGRAVLAHLRTGATRADGMAYWIGADQDGSYHAKTMASTTRSTALALSALIALAPDDPLVAESVRYLMAERRAEGWGTTNETSFAILALTDELMARKARVDTTAYTVRVNGVEVVQGVLGEVALSRRITLPTEAFHAGVNTLTLVRRGGPLYYTATSRWYTEQIQVRAAGAIMIERRYVDPDTRKDVGAFSVGQVVRVSLAVTLPRDGAFMLIEDPIPGGLEPINERLNTSSYDATFSASCWLYGAGCDPYRYQELGYNQKEIRADRVSFFVTEMDNGLHRITYLARVVKAGRFTALPTTAAAMYDDTYWGRSASAGVIITP